MLRFWAATVFATGLFVLGLTSPGLAQQRGGPAGAFDFYVLALSWSAGFCAVDGDFKGRDQCAAGKGLGFVVHGLWPQNERGYPVECGPQGRSPTSMAMEVARDVYPDQGLARYQWRKHGTCAGTSPTDYFNDAKAARARVVIPQAFQGRARETRWNPSEVLRAFTQANPGLRADMMAVSCKRGILDEVRICLTRDLRGFRTCAEVSRDSCRTREIVAPAVR
jgi:ribonuclease T2